MAADRLRDFFFGGLSFLALVFFVIVRVLP